MQIKLGKSFRATTVDRRTKRIKHFADTLLRRLDQARIFLSSLNLFAHLGDGHASVQKLFSIFQNLDCAVLVTLTQLEGGISHHNAFIGIRCGTTARTIIDRLLVIVTRILLLTRNVGDKCCIINAEQAIPLRAVDLHNIGERTLRIALPYLHPCTHKACRELIHIGLDRQHQEWASLAILLSRNSVDCQSNARKAFNLRLILQLFRKR